MDHSTTMESFRSALWNSWLLRIGFALAITGGAPLAWSLAHLDLNPEGGAGALANNLLRSVQIIVAALALAAGMFLMAATAAVIAWSRSRRSFMQQPNAAARIVHADGSQERLRVTQLSPPDRYRLEETSQLGQGVLHDVVQLNVLRDGSLQFVRIVEPSNLVTQRFTAPEELLSTDVFRQVHDAIVNAGGICEVKAKGVLLVHTSREQAGPAAKSIERLLHVT